MLNLVGFEGDQLNNANSTERQKLFSLSMSSMPMSNKTSASWLGKLPSGTNDEVRWCTVIVRHEKENIEQKTASPLLTLIRFIQALLRKTVVPLLPPP
jgi:hypothetical protein